jgi:tetratricopeptide (TPR) repeat protein
MTVWQARRSVLVSIASARTGRFGVIADRSSFRWTLDGFEFDATLQNSGREHFKVDLRSLESVFARKRRFRLGYTYGLTDEAGRDISSPLDRLNYDAAVAESLAAALNRLREFAGDKGAKLREFTQRAAEWRALPSKPPVPEEVRVQRLLAEDAIKQNKPGEALNCYETGLELFPTWPQGRFNAALIAAELGYYAEAIEHMQAYLELVPDAPDAQSARDQVAIWQFKAKETK